jgi:hypothetical protein
MVTAMDDEVERIMNMTEAELRADIKAQGLDWDEEVAKAKVCFELAVADVEFKKGPATMDMDLLKAAAKKGAGSVGPKSRWA